MDIKSTARIWTTPMLTFNSHDVINVETKMLKKAGYEINNNQIVHTQDVNSSAVDSRDVNSSDINRDVVEHDVNNRDMNNSNASAIGCLQVEN